MIKRFLKNNFIWSFASVGLTALVGFINLSLIAHHFNRHSTGQWFMLFTIYYSLDILKTGCVQIPFIRYFVMAGDGKEKSALIAISWQLSIGLSAVLAIIVSIVSFFFFAGSDTFYLVPRFTALWLFSAIPYQLAQWQLQAKGEFKKQAIVRLAFPVVFTFFLLAKLHFHITIVLVAIAYMGIQFSVGLLAWFVNWLQLGSWKTVQKAQLKKIIGFSKYGLLSMIATSLLKCSDQVIIGYWLGASAVALYAIPQKLIEIIEIPIRSFAIIAITKATAFWHEKKYTRLRDFFYGQTSVLTLIILPILLFLLLFPSFILNIMGGSQYTGSPALLQVFCIYSLLLPFDRFCNILLDATGQPQKNMQKAFLMLGINIAGDITALWLGMGLYGVAASSFLTFLAGFIFGVFKLQNVLGAFSLKKFWSTGVSNIRAKLHQLQAAGKSPG